MSKEALSKALNDLCSSCLHERDRDALAGFVEDYFLNEIALKCRETETETIINKPKGQSADNTIRD